MSLESALEPVCICILDRIIRGCPRHHPVPDATPESIHAMLIKSLENQEKIMAGLSDLQAAVASEGADLTSLLTEWQKFLTDVQAALANDDADAAVEAAAQQVQQQDTQVKNLIAQLQSNDPANAAASAGTASGTPAGTAASGTATDTGTTSTDSGSAPSGS